MAPCICIKLKAVLELATCDDNVASVKTIHGGVDVDAPGQALTVSQMNGTILYLGQSCWQRRRITIAMVSFVAGALTAIHVLFLMR